MLLSWGLTSTTEMLSEPGPETPTTNGSAVRLPSCRQHGPEPSLAQDLGILKDSSTLHPMGMNIKDPEVHAMARQLAARRGTTVTNAVRQALSAELERSQAVNAARQDDLQALLERFRKLHWPEGVNGQEAQDALYHEQGLPL